ncbi:hypothetical protein AVEN_39061-1 [Araneus ventricosus]|uniref:Uncharacterized protein n=1 Tax=Araneus ventricosus TaxID=182803 RepID=A0A4Y2KXN6_ARAVE|nr:hypothetical protein AVEN_39061-1 [Araneus ventricosus]
MFFQGWPEAARGAKAGVLRKKNGLIGMKSPGKRQIISLSPNTLRPVALGIFLPLTFAAGKRRFSKVKTDQTYLRFTMSQEGLVGIATRSTERDFLQNIEIEKIMKDLADKKE